MGTCRGSHHSHHRAEDGFDQVERLNDLKGISPTKGSTYAKDAEQTGEQTSQMLQVEVFETIRKIVHCASHDFAVFSYPSVFLAENALREFRRHAKESDQDYPKHRTRSACSDCNCNPRNVSKSDRGRESRGQGLKVSDFPF